MARRIGSSGAQTADSLAKAALRLFARHGYAAVSMRMIAREVGVQPGALYNHVGSKQDLLRDLMIGHMTELMKAFRAQPLPEDPAAALEAFTRFHVRFHIDRADAVFISYMELRSLEPENFRAVERLRQEYEGILRGILERGARAGVMHAPDPPVAARAIISMLTGVTHWFREGGRLTARQIEDIYTDMVARSVSARPAADGASAPDDTPKDTERTACSTQA
ncbi:TetR/AcrR family transcriptional regulator [Oceanicella actignis]|uniref:TetR/AcrR family transcriptional regulator n=1 Tax=Oceanicella actignis TaxID=1189325 RepID=UPI0011E84992|nr:TetR/AcrR family transcriptional regulator [Oceanicella actignis]TYO84864.1 TetR family transcriptional regulator [Oceanicella actignis]